jgi:predicted negative regulator of RcsB-dependent stress response
MIRRRSTSVVLAALLSALAGTAVAQQRSAECAGLRYSNFRLNSAKLYLDNATRFQRSDPGRSAAELGRAFQQVSDAARAGGGDEMTQWFFFGEIALMRGDLVGADSMFTRAEAKSDSTCRREMVRMRRNEWAPLVNGAINQLAANNQDSAVVLLRRSTVIFRDSPVAYLRLGAIFAGHEQADSAIAYFKLAGRSGDSPREQEFRQAALFSAAQLQQGRQRWADAEATFRDFRRIAPRDLAGMAGLGAALTAQNKTAEATALYDTLTAAADTVSDPDNLFETATQMVHARRYALAARLYERELTINRCHRDGLYNLASTYNSMQDSARMLPVARRLAEVDPMNRGSLAMLAQAYVLRRDTTSIGTLQRLQALPWAFDLVQFTVRDTTATVLAGVSNLQERALPAFRLTIEFLNGACEPVSQEVVEVPQIEANGSHSVNVTGRGRGILAYRYKTN